MLRDLYMCQLPEQEPLQSFLLRKQYVHCITKPWSHTPVGLLTSYDCTCPEFLHHATCKHVLAYMVHIRYISIPAELNVTRIGRNRRPCRPRNVGPALTPMQDILQHIDPTITDVPDDYVENEGYAI